MIQPAGSRVQPFFPVIRLVLAACCFLFLFTLTARADQHPGFAPERFYGLNFSAPLHNPGQKPVVGTGPQTPAAVSGNPLVTAIAPILTSQPLLLNTELGNGPCCYREAISLALPESSPQYVISFDLVTEKLLGSRNRFQLLLDEAATPLLSFNGDGLLMLHDNDAIAGFSDGSLLHLQLRLDLAGQQLALSINGEAVHVAPLTLDRVRAVHLTMSSADGQTPDRINPEPYAAVDNIVIANATYQYANLQTTLKGGSGFGRWQDGKIEYIVKVKNISAHAARDLVVTQLLPPGVTLESARSDQLSCLNGGQRVECSSPLLEAMAEAFITLTVATPDAKTRFEFSSIATSASDEIDNYDNQARSRFGGSAGLLMLLGVILLLLLRWDANE